MDFSLASPVLSEAANMGQNWAGASSVRSLAIRDILGVQDEEAIKKQKRKEANRMSAQRSRLRKQAECDELKRQVETLSSENQNLRSELQRLSEECEKLNSDNNSLKGLLISYYGPNTMPNMDNNGPPCQSFFG